MTNSGVRTLKEDKDLLSSVKKNKTGNIRYKIGNILEKGDEKKHLGKMIVMIRS